MSDLLAGIGRSFVVSSLVPASVFTLIAMALVRPWLQRWLSVPLEGLGAGAEGTIYLVIVFFAGFTLYSLNISVYRFFEGYTVRLPWALQRHKRSLHRLLLKRKALEILFQTPGWIPEARAEFRKHLLQIYGQLQRSYPSRLDLVMPTTFGNILRAYEEYPNLHYGIDGVLAWPHLLDAASKRFLDFYEENNNKITFILNSSLLSLLLSILSLFGLAFSLANGTGSGQLILIYATAAVSFMFGAWAFYRAVLPLAVEQGYLFRTAFDLFRFPLLETLRIKDLPENPEAETQLWADIQEHWWAGQRLNLLQPDSHPNLKFQHGKRPAPGQSEAGNVPYSESY